MASSRSSHGRRNIKLSPLICYVEFFSTGKFAANFDLSSLNTKKIPGLDCGEQTGSVSENSRNDTGEAGSTRKGVT